MDEQDKPEIKFGSLICGFGTEKGPVQASIFLPFGGSIIEERLDPNMPELRAVNDMFALLKQYPRRPPKHLLEELARRQEALQMAIQSQRAMQGLFAGMSRKAREVH